MWMDHVLMEQHQPQSSQWKQAAPCAEHSLPDRCGSKCYKPGAHLGCGPYGALRCLLPSDVVGPKDQWHRGWPGTWLWPEVWGGGGGGGPATIPRA